MSQHTDQHTLTVEQAPPRARRRSRAQELLAGLNDPQREAVLHQGSPLLVVAGAGSGKTRVLTRRIAYLVSERDAHPASILAITFTNKAAAEMRQRVADIIGNRARIMWVSTFHSACVRILRAEIHRFGYARQFSIYDDADAKRLMQLVCGHLHLDPKRHPVRQVLNWVSDCKNDLVDHESAASRAGAGQELYPAAYAEYQRRLRAANALDFDDLNGAIRKRTARIASTLGSSQVSQRLIGKAKARRALGVENTTDVLAGNSATIDEDLSIKGLVTHGLAALAISALGLAVAGSVALTGSAQAAEVTRTSSAVQGSPDQSQAVPAEESQRIAEEQAAVNEVRNAEEQAATDGQLDAFGRSADGVSRNAVRNEIDRAVADQKAKERGAALEDTGEKVIETSGAALNDARQSNLKNTAAATKREQDRLAEEKRKAEEALRAAQQATEQETVGGTLQEAAPAAAAAAPAPAPQQVGPVDTAGVAGSAATPLPPGRYTVGARWGAVGSWSRYHTGQDLGSPIGTPVRAAANGVVVSPNAGGWAGVHVVVQHSNGSSLYAHLSSATVRPGQQVTAGQVIGYVGMTGRTFGPHLHFEYYPVGAQTSNPYSSSDPYRWLLTMGVRM